MLQLSSQFLTMSSKSCCQSGPMIAGGSSQRITTIMRNRMWIRKASSSIRILRFLQVGYPRSTSPQLVTRPGLGINGIASSRASIEWDPKRGRRPRRTWFEILAACHKDLLMYQMSTTSPSHWNIPTQLNYFREFDCVTWTTNAQQNRHLLHATRPRRAVIDSD
jgi:hypothetical protein